MCIIFWLKSLQHVFRGIFINRWVTFIADSNNIATRNSHMLVCFCKTAEKQHCWHWNFAVLRVHYVCYREGCLGFLLNLETETLYLWKRCSQCWVKSFFPPRLSIHQSTFTLALLTVVHWLWALLHRRIIIFSKQAKLVTLR